MKFVRLATLVLVGALGWAPTAQAGTVLRFDQTLEIDGGALGSDSREAVLWLEDSQARFHWGTGSTILTADGRLIDLLGDELAVEFPTPVRLENLVTGAEQKILDRVRELMRARTEVRWTGVRKQIGDYPAELVEIETVLEMGGRIETGLWVTTAFEGSLEPFETLAANWARLRLDAPPWLRLVGRGGVGLPVAVETVIEGNGPRRVETMQLRTVEALDIAAETWSPDEGAERVPFRLDCYVQYHQ